MYRALEAMGSQGGAGVGDGGEGGQASDFLSWEGGSYQRELSREGCYLM